MERAAHPTAQSVTWRRYPHVLAAADPELAFPAAEGDQGAESNTYYLAGRLWGLRTGRAWAYLVVVGSLVGFTAYAWLLRVAPISLVVTHQYVNPLVAIGLGMAFLGERPSPLALLGSALVIGSVYIAIRAEFPRRATPALPATVVPQGTPAGQTP